MSRRREERNNGNAQKGSHAYDRRSVVKRWWLHDFRFHFKRLNKGGIEPHYRPSRERNQQRDIEHCCYDEITSRARAFCAQT
jgi:hypothetical protein